MSYIPNLDRKGIEALLTKVAYGHLGTVDGEGNSYVVPIGFKYVDGLIYMFFDHDYGRKAENLIDNSNVCFEVTDIIPSDAIHRGRELHGHDSVIVIGKCVKVTDEVEQTRIYGAAILKRARERGGGFVYKITPEAISGKTYRRRTA